ncbi:MAG TPA: class I SAM-dependent methyltransferase [Solirubrobacter sp.]
MIAALEWSSGSMVPAGFAAVCAEVAARDRPTVVECGSGFSTLALARLVREREGRLVSLEHDEVWVGRVREHLAAAGLGGTAEVLLAPLEPGAGLPWYAEEALRSVPDGIDVLLVDGPPAFEPGTGLSRYPALPVLLPRLAEGAVVVLDDLDRVGEQQVLAAWTRECGFRFEVRPLGRIAVGRRT